MSGRQKAVHGIALEVEGLNAFYGRSQAIFDIKIGIGESEILAVLGRNGVGKTTMLTAIAGMISTRATAIRLGASDISQLPAFKRVRAGLAFVPSGSRAFPNLTVEENLTLVKSSIGVDAHRRWTIDDVFETFKPLRQSRHKPAGSLSGGQRQMLSIGRALLANPRVLMMDEPSEGLGPIVVRTVGGILRSLTNQGIAILLTEQNHVFALSVAHRVSFMEKGRIVWHGESEDAKKGEVLSRFLAV